MSLLNSAFDIVKLCARRLGISISYYPPPDSLQRHLRDYLSRMKINVVLDVGAFVGQYAMDLRNDGYEGRIISFEPVPDSYRQLCARLRGDSLWSGQPFGLSDCDGDAVMKTYAEGNFNSLLSLREDAGKAYSLDAALRSQATIQLRRLDTVLPKLLEGIPSPRVFLKMDTQGHDVSIVKGAAGVLDTVIGLQSELPAIEIYDGMSSMSVSLSYYASRGFVPIGFYPVNTFSDILVTPEFDVILNHFDGILKGPRSDPQR